MARDEIRAPDKLTAAHRSWRTEKDEVRATPYVFPGMTPFIADAAEVAGVELHHVGYIRESWHVKRLQDALGQLPQMDADSRATAMEAVGRIRAGMVAQLAAADAAIADVAAGCEVATAKGAKK